MQPTVKTNRYELHNADVFQWAQGYNDPRFHACLCDPPYELGFMGKKWDSSGVAFQPSTWSAISDCLLPGAYLLAFGGTRTFHRLACAIEDAGFEIRDTIMWVYGSGFPKSHDVSKAIDKAAGAVREVVGKSSRHGGGTLEGKSWNIPSEIPDITTPSTPLAKTWDGYGTALKPAWEPVIVARKPLDGTVAENCVEYGAGALWIDGARVGMEEIPAQGNGGHIQSTMPGKAQTDYYTNQGRWPANLIHDGSDEVVGLFPMTNGGTYKAPNAIHRKAHSLIPSDGMSNAPDNYGDSGSAARFFYCAKASKRERDAGCEGNHHPTVKPIALTEYLAKLILPPASYKPRRLLVPFCGSGSEMIGALRAGWDEVTGIDNMAEYLEIAGHRIEALAPAALQDPLFTV